MNNVRPGPTMLIFKEIGGNLCYYVHILRIDLLYYYRSKFGLILCWQEHLNMGLVTRLCTLHLNTLFLSCDEGGFRPCNTYIHIRDLNRPHVYRTNGRKDCRFICASTGTRFKKLKMRCFSTLWGRTKGIPHFSPLDCWIFTVTQWHSDTTLVPRFLFLYGICLIPALKYIIFCLLSLFWKNKSRLIRSLCCLSLPPINFRILAPAFMKLDIVTCISD
jgi:hypothetical protein